MVKRCVVSGGCVVRRCGDVIMVRRECGEVCGDVIMVSGGRRCGEEEGVVMGTSVHM